MNFFQTLGQVTDIEEPSFMRGPTPQQAQPNVMMGGTQPGSVGGPTMADIERNAGVPAPAKRSGMLDVIGGVADYIAEMGGAKPGYQSTIDARTQREREAELYPLEKQKLQLGNQATVSEIRARQAKMVSPLAARALEVLDKGGEAELFRIMPLMYQTLGLTPEEVQQYDAQVRANPRGALTMWAGLGEADGATEYGTTVNYDKDEKGNLYPWIVGKDGSKKYLPVEEGRTVAPTMQIADTGFGYQGINRQTGLPSGPTVDKTGDPSKGTQFGTDERGNPTVAPVLGGAMDLELNEKATTLENLDNALGAMSDMFPAMLGNIEDLARAGSLTGVPEDKVGSDGKPLKAGNKLTAMIYQNVPLTEQAFNDAGFSAREKIMSQGMSSIAVIEPLLRSAQEGNAQLSSRMMDTPKELENLLKQVVNVKDYGAAMDAYTRFKNRYDEVRRELQEKMKAARQKTAAGRQSSAPTSATSTDGWSYVGPKK